MNNSNLQPEQNDDDYDYYCSTCNMKVGKYDKFCKNCGTELENEIVDYNEDANYSDN
jgi:rRNA maturation endonuclease Nob1